MICQLPIYMFSYVGYDICNCLTIKNFAFTPLLDLLKSAL